MSLVKIFVDSVSSINKRMNAIEDAIVSISKNVSSMSQIIGESVGQVIFKGNVEFKEGDLDRLFSNKSKLQIEALMLDLSFSQGMLAKVDGQVKNKIYNILKEGEVKYLKDLIDQHKRLEVMITECEGRTVKLAEAQIKANKRVDIDINSKVANANKKIVDHIENSLINVEKGIEAIEYTKQEMKSVIKDALVKSAILDNKIVNDNTGRKR